MVFPVVAEVPSARYLSVISSQRKPAKKGNIAEKRLAEIDFRTVKPGDRLEMGIGQRQVA